MGETRIAAADHVSFTIEKGEFCVILGPSGAGKTTVLNMLGGMDTSDEGKIWLDGEEVSAFDQKQLTRYRRYDVGFVFQFYNLVQNLTAREMSSWPRRSAATRWTRTLCWRRWACPTAATTSRRSFRAASSSACPSRARSPKTRRSSCAMSPPARWTTRPANRCWRCCRPPAAKKGRTVIVITHNSALAAMADRVIRINSGRVVDMQCNPAPTPVERIEW